MSGLLGEEQATPQATLAQPKVYYDLPEMVVNLSSGDKRVQYLKLKVALEAESQTTVEALKPVMPRILDAFQLYLRELRSSDLEGSAGIFRLKEELLRRINTEIQPYKVSRVLFKEIIVQ
ncbi:MAG: flagellar basal body-associated protein FliL [Alphaproteobacteria bacterium]|nr:MAG: flagellar basal body-associated protein FliL [Alphaproteobacteria bacterium]